ncbi:MAG: GreA/GreB family elongation factor [Paenibacillus sp.]|nr:GreA/GreB family elongation factor [Paenibacillus sp.]
MSHSTHSQNLRSLREHLIHQLILLGEEKNDFLNTYYPDHGSTRLQMDQFLTTYTNFLEKQLALPDENLHQAVFIGSGVKIAYLDSNEVDEFTIVYPDEADPYENAISFLSPVGKNLLMATLSDVLTIKTPSGTMQIQLLDIDNSTSASTD